MSGERKTILVIDDQKDTREIIVNTLEGDEFEVLTAPGGREGIQIARLHNPDVILLDLEMPRYNGIQTCVAMKRTPKIKDIPVIFLTAHTGRDVVSEAIKAGGVDYIVKPFNPDELKKRIIEALPQSKREFDPSSVVNHQKPAGNED